MDAVTIDLAASYCAARPDQTPQLIGALFLVAADGVDDHVVGGLIFPDSHAEGGLTMDRLTMAVLSMQRLSALIRNAMVQLQARAILDGPDSLGVRRN